MRAFITGSYFRLRYKDVGHAIRSAVPENPIAARTLHRSRVLDATIIAPVTLTLTLTR